MKKLLLLLLVAGAFIFPGCRAYSRAYLDGWMDGAAYVTKVLSANKK